MFRKSFKPAKCKKALQLAVMRIKFANQNREAKLKQLRKEVSALLHNLQHQTATIRVEEVVLEQNRMVAFDLIGIYCELIASRMPLIECDRNCPSGAKEAISSVIFASMRFTEIPELMNVRMHFTSKYGKQFVSDAIELRRDCGVNHVLAEKSSHRAPDGPTKIKMLASIAEEHNIKWNPNDIVESTFEKAAYVEPSEVHAPPVHDEEGPVNSCATSQLEPMYDASTHSYEKKASCAAREASGNHSTTSNMPNVEIRSSGDGRQEMNFEDSYSKNQSDFLADNLDMESKGAASAAHADISSSLRALNKTSDSDSYDVVVNSQKTAGTHEPHIQNKKMEAKNKSRLWASIRYFDSDDSDSEDELHKRNSATVARPIRRISQRT